MALISTSTAVGWAVSPIIGRMVSMVESYLSSQYRWNSQMMSDLNNLESTLMEILLVVGAAERRHILDRNQEIFLHRMKDAVYDAEDVMDEFDYMLLGQNKESIVSHIATSSLTIGKRLIGLDKFRSNLQKVLKSLERVKACAEMLVQVLAVENSNSFQSLEGIPARASGSLLHEDVVFGREKELNELVGQLLKQYDESDQGNGRKSTPEVHTIVGVGGIGKTTLAQLIYNDERIVEKFDLRIWVCVSSNFDKIRLIKEIIACAADDKDIDLTNYNFSMLQKQLEGMLSYKRFLLVLDDVWYDEKFGEHINTERWKHLMAAMRNRMRGVQPLIRGSKILVTTRMELVAKMLDSVCSFSLRGLEIHDSWLVFRKYAFGRESPEAYLELRRKGDQIVQKLKGLPLALKVIGGHLNANYSSAKWKEVLDKDVLDPDDIFTILRLSYDSLPEHLQKCFAYCSLFPKDFRIDPKKLVHMWAAHGFVRPGRSAKRSLEDIGRDYFNELLARSFFQMLQCGPQTYYVMHDAMNDLALHVSQGECIRVECDSLEEVPHFVRHLTVSAEYVRKLTDCDLRRLHSLIVLNKSWFCSKVILSHEMLSKCKKLRVLDVSGCCLQSLPDAVGHFIHLRYLCIRRTDHPLPETISGLRHLQALFVQYHSCYSPGKYASPRKKNTIGCHFSLPKSINKLANLVCVDVDKAYVLVLSGMCQLPCVEGAGEFHVHKEEPSLAGLKDLNKLQGQLAIRLLENVKGREEAAKAQLDRKEHIAKLELEWGSIDHASDIEKGLEVLDVLKPHPNLEELNIIGYPGAKSPSWLESGWLSGMRLICLRDCERWEALPPLGDLPLLRALEVRRMNGLKIAGPEFYGHAGFPALERLLLERLPKLELSKVQNGQVFPNLRELFITECPRLREYPIHLRTLKHIAILDSNKNFILKHVRQNFEMSRSFCSLLSSFFHILHDHQLKPLEVLCIHVDHLAGISKVALRNLKSLKELKIYGHTGRMNYTCSIISTFWDECGSTVLPTSLQFLELSGCYLRASSFSKLLNNFLSLDTLRLNDCYPVGMPCQSPISLCHSRMLKQLHIYQCDWVTSFEGSEALVSLKEMTIEHCYDLERIPDIENMPALEKLHVLKCPQVMQLSQSSHQTALKELVIESCDALLSLEELRGLVSLQKLKVTGCSDLVSLPDMDAFYSLRILIIQMCPQLKLLPRSGLPVSLKALFLFACHPLLEEQFRRKEGPDWNKVAALSGCMCCSGEEYR